MDLKQEEAIKNVCAVDSECGFLWQVANADGNVSGSLIISGATSRLYACLGNALGVRGDLLPFVFVFSICCTACNTGCVAQCFSPE